MKPDWKDAPEWAQWLAQDANGIWYWHENEPHIAGKSWWSDGEHRAVEKRREWRETLEQRPTQDKPS